MKQNKNNKEQEDIISRRQFFKKAAGYALPILAMGLAPSFLSSCEIDEELPGDNLGCDSCKNNCSETCKGGCIGQCSSSCYGTCSNTCSTTCKGGCSGSCSNTCLTSCKNSCGTSCKKLKMSR